MDQFNFKKAAMQEKEPYQKPGYLLDDIGSGYRISQEAVATALEKMDRGENYS